MRISDWSSDVCSSDLVVVDVGCGAGVNSVFCARHGAYVYAIDREPQVIREVRARLSIEAGGTHAALVSDANPLPLEDGMATRVICTEVLQHVDDPQQVLAELRSEEHTSELQSLLRL